MKVRGIAIIVFTILPALSHLPVSSIFPSPISCGTDMVTAEFNPNNNACKHTAKKQRASPNPPSTETSSIHETNL